VKRVFDGIAAGLALLVLLPLFLVIALLIRWRMGPPVFYRQLRSGLHGRTFELVKFRTMRQAVEGTDAERLTPLGGRLRESSLDELPQLWNVVKGDMSLVGPRPLLPSYLPRYSARQARRHEVRPGLTGWAQVHGRNAISWEERLELDVWYVEHRSLGLDLKIIWRTFRKVLNREGISEPGHATMTEFPGASNG
jgi:lipopolysaccharide/colanic/teichoic acid biosynthesis glycosyltransferase